MTLAKLCTNMRSSSMEFTSKEVKWSLVSRLRKRKLKLRLQKPKRNLHLLPKDKTHHLLITLLLNNFKKILRLVMRKMSNSSQNGNLLRQIKSFSDSVRIPLENLLSDSLRNWQQVRKVLSPLTFRLLNWRMLPYDRLKALYVRVTKWVAGYT